MEINEICQALPIIKTQKVEWSDNRNGNLSHPKYSDEVLNWINQFGTLNIADKDYIDNIEQIKQKNVSELTRDETLTRLTAIIRGERFCEGILAKAIESGKLEELCVHLHKITSAEPFKTRILLSDLLKNNGIKPEDVVMIRHVLSREHCKQCYQNGFIKEYTQIQGKNKTMLKNSKYWMVFIGTTGTNAKLYCVYKFKGFSPVSEHKMPTGFPCPEMYSEDANLYELEETDLFSDLKDGLIIDWGTSTQSWYQSATKNKHIVSIHNNNKIPFKGYENAIYSFDELQEIVNDMGIGAYEEHYNALSKVKGVYLIVDTTDGKQYVGSAYGDNGILGRWAIYANTHHGGNKKMIELLKKHPERYKSFRFTILKIFSDGAKDIEVIDSEKLYKQKLGTIEHGLNDN